MILTEKQQKYQLLSSGTINKYEYLTVEEILPSNQRQIIEQAKFAYSPLGKSFEKQREKQVGALKHLYFSVKKDQLKQIEKEIDKLKEFDNLQDIIKKYDLNYKSKCVKTYNFGKYSLHMVF